jgi:hypothetical protein
MKTYVLEFRVKSDSSHALAFLEAIQNLVMIIFDMFGVEHLQSVSAQESEEKNAPEEI